MATERTTRAEARVAIGGRRFGLVYATLMIAMLLAALDQTIFSTALPTIVGELHGLEHMAWVTTAYILASTIVMPLYGKVGDLLGRRSVFIAAIGLFTVGSIVAAIAGSMPVLVAGRAVQGLGGGGLMILAQAIVADLVPARERGKYMAPIGVVFGLSSVIGPLLGGWLTDEHSWRWALWINVPLGILAIIIALTALRLPKPTGAVDFDALGSGLLMVSTTSIVLLGTWGGTQYEWTSPVIIGLACGATVTWSGFIIVERRAPDPVIPLSLFVNRTFVLATLVGMLTVGVGMFALVGYLPTYLQMVYGVSATASGLLLLPLIGGLIITAGLSGVIISRTGRLKPMPLIGSIVVGVAVGLFSTLGTDTSLWVVSSCTTLAGLGLGLLMQTLVLAVQNEFPARMVGTVTASNNYFREVGASLGTAIIGSVFASRLTDHLAGAVAAGSALDAADVDSLTPALVRSLPLHAREVVIDAYAESLLPIFGYLVPVFFVGVVLTLFLKDAPLSDEDVTSESG